MESPREIVIVGFQGIQGLDLTGPWEVMDAAVSLTGLDPAPYNLRWVTVDGEPVRTSSGLTVIPDGRLDEVEVADTMIVAGGWGIYEAIDDRELVAGIERLSRVARRTAGVCSGAFLLAEAGLLDGRRAVTHWKGCDELAARYPRVEVDPEPIFIRDGSVITSAGVTAGIDLALALVEEDLGPDVALDVARWMVVYARRSGGQSQFSVQLSHPPAGSADLRELQRWIAGNLDGDLSVGALAGRVHLSERQFSRRFRAELGTTPADYVEQVRVERARGLLEAGDAAIDQVARACGFTGAEVMRRAFRRRLGTNPRAYRERFRVGPGAAERASV